MKRFFLFVFLVVASNAYADWRPVSDLNQYVVKVSYKDDSNVLSYSENASANGPIRQFATSLVTTPVRLNQALNSWAQVKAAGAGASFVNGIVTGNGVIDIQPDSSKPGFSNISLNGLNYILTSKFSATRYGIFTVNCINTLSINNISIVGKYNAWTGDVEKETSKLNANFNSSTDCDTNLDWIPFLGNFIDMKLENYADNLMLTSVQEQLGELNKGLLKKPGDIGSRGLSQVIPIDKVIKLSTGESFSIGQYLQNNVNYLIANASLHVELGDPPKPILPVAGREPEGVERTANLASITLTSQSVKFTVAIDQHLISSWRWYCPVGSKSCGIQ